MQVLLFAHRAEASVFIRELQLVPSTNGANWYSSPKSKVALLLTGQGAENVEKTCQKYRAEINCASSLVNIGTCGRLSDQRLADTFFISVAKKIGVQDFSLATPAPCSLSYSCLTVDHPISSAKDRSDCGIYAPVVDMELYTLIQCLKHLNCPFYAIKTISDDATRALSRAELKEIAEYGSRRLFDFYLQSSIKA